METIQLIRHYQESFVGNLQGWHPSTLMRWLLFLIPLIYYLAIRILSQISKQKSSLQLLKFSMQSMKQQSLLQHIHFRQSGLCDLIILFIGLYAVIADAWSTKEWVIWAAMLIFAGLMLLFSHSKNYGFVIIAAIFSFGCFFMTQWLFAQTRDMNDNTWKHLVRIFHGFNVASTLLNFLTRFYKIVGHYCSWQMATYTNALSITYLLTCIGLTILNIIAYGPFLDVIGFIIGWIFSVFFVCLLNVGTNLLTR